MLNLLVAKNERLTTTNATNLAKIKTLLSNGENAQAGGGTESVAGRGTVLIEVSALKRQVQLQADVHFKWMKGSF